MERIGNYLKGEDKDLFGLKYEPFAIDAKL